MFTLVFDQITRTITLDTSFPYSKIVAFRVSSFKSDDRRHYPGMNRIVEDEYDDQCVHILSIKNQHLTGCARLLRAKNGHLPFSHEVPDLEIKECDFELSRFITFPHKEGRKAFLYVLISAAFALSCVSLEQICGIFADVIVGQPRTLNINTYLSFGFRDLGQGYFDNNYGVFSKIFRVHSSEKNVFFGSVQRLASHLKGLEYDSSVNFEAIRNKLLRLG